MFGSGSFGVPTFSRLDGGLKAIFPSEQCALQNFFGLELFSIPLGPPEGVSSMFIMAGSTGNMRLNEEDEYLADHISCLYPGMHARTVGKHILRSLNYEPPSAPASRT